MTQVARAQSLPFTRTAGSGGKAESVTDALGEVGAGLENADAREALRLRCEWMRVVGLSEVEIAELSQCREPPLAVEEERKNLDAAKKLPALTPSYQRLRELAQRATTNGSDVTASGQ